MAETITTGGVKSFQYKKGHSPKLDQKQRDEIRDAYAKADERKRDKKRNRIIIMTVIVLIILAILYMLLM